MQIQDSLGEIDWANAETLDLSFRRVAKIENIVCFDKLASLSLSNNRIKDVANLEHLKTLTALDLSFNLVETLPESLRMLTALRELSLFSNELTDLRVIDEIPQLSVLNVGKSISSRV